MAHALTHTHLTKPEKKPKADEFESKPNNSQNTYKIRRKKNNVHVHHSPTAAGSVATVIIRLRIRIGSGAYAARRRVSRRWVLFNTATVRWATVAAVAQAGLVARIATCGCVGVTRSWRTIECGAIAACGYSWCCLWSFLLLFRLFGCGLFLAATFRLVFFGCGRCRGRSCRRRRMIGQKATLERLLFRHHFDGASRAHIGRRFGLCRLLARCRTGWLPDGRRRRWALGGCAGVGAGRPGGGLFRRRSRGATTALWLGMRWRCGYWGVWISAAADSLTIFGFGFVCLFVFIEFVMCEWCLLSVIMFFFFCSSFGFVYNVVDGGEGDIRRSNICGSFVSCSRTILATTLNIFWFVFVKWEIFGASDTYIRYLNTLRFDTAFDWHSF